MKLYFIKKIDVIGPGVELKISGFCNITPLYKFFNKKSIVQDFLMYNEFATTITKESDPVR